MVLDFTTVEPSTSARARVTEDVNQSCPFCLIARASDPPARVVAADAGWIAFFPLQPATPGHTLLIPRAHHIDLWRADPATIEQLGAAATLIGRGLRKALDPDGLNLITSAGAAAEQTVFHLHLHLVPRWANDSFGPLWPQKGLVPEAEADTAYELVRREFEP